MNVLQVILINFAHLQYFLNIFAKSIDAIPCQVINSLSQFVIATYNYMYSEINWTITSPRNRKIIFDNSIVTPLPFFNHVKFYILPQKQLPIPIS
jgi:hypothetical protein